MNAWRATLLSLTVAAALWCPADARAYYYEVRPNDTLNLIASRHKISTATLAKANNLRTNSRLAAGTKIWVSAGKPKVAPKPKARTSARSQSASSQRRLPVIDTSKRREPPKQQPARPASAGDGEHRVQPGDSLWAISRRHNVSVQELVSWNGLRDPNALEVGQVLKVSGAALPEIPGGGIQRGSAPAEQASRAPEPPPPSAPPVGSSLRPSSKGYIWPAEGRLIRRFVDRADDKYPGIDIAVPKGTEIRAARDGEVVYTGDTIPGYGQLIIIEHSGQMATCYSQLGRTLVREGQKVKRGQVIARSGADSHGDEMLHFEIRRNGEAINPLSMLP